MHPTTLFFCAIFMLMGLCCSAVAASPVPEIENSAPVSSPEATTNAFKQWDDAQAETATKFNARDHQYCIDAGFIPRSWGNPDTEKYYLCRARIIEERSLPLPPGVSKNTQSRAALFFHQKAHEAQYAFRIADEQSHQECVNQSGPPGAMDDPKTRLYYQCRAKLAERDMGPKIAMMFRQKMNESSNATLDAERCFQRGFKKADPNYAECRRRSAVARLCVQNISKKLAEKRTQDTKDCNEEAKLQLPDTMIHGEHRAYTNAQELEKARQKLSTICMRERETLLEQYKIGLTLECRGN